MKAAAWVAGLVLLFGMGTAMGQVDTVAPRLPGATNDRPSLLKPLPPRRDDVSPLARLLSEARDKIEKRRYAEVYEALSARLDLYAGDVEFDYLYGIAAMESDAPGKAVLALERVLINKPDHLLARAELARAYLLVREQENARREFEAVAAQKIPPQAREVINRYLDALTRAKDQPGLSTRYEVMLEAGHDSNVNVASQSDRWLLADGTQVYPLPPSQPRSSLFLGAGGGVDLAIPINGLVQWTTGLKGMLRKYPSAHTLDQEQVDFSTGFAYRKQCHQFKMLGQLQLLTLGGNPFRRATGLVGQWQCDLNSRRQIGAYAQRFDLDFADQGQRNATRQALGITFAQVLPPLNDSVLLATLQSGSENAKANLANLSFDFTGIRLLLTAAITSNWRALVGFNWEERRFDGAEPLFGVIRHDRQSEVRLGLESALDAHWTLQPQIVHTRNRSTLAPSDFSRTQAFLVARYRLQ